MVELEAQLQDKQVRRHADEGLGLRGWDSRAASGWNLGLPLISRSFPQALELTVGVLRAEIAGLMGQLEETQVRHG